MASGSYARKIRRISQESPTEYANNTEILRPKLIYTNTAIPPDGKRRRLKPRKNIPFLYNCIIGISIAIMFCCLIYLIVSSLAAQTTSERLLSYGGGKTYDITVGKTIEIKQPPKKTQEQQKSVNWPFYIYKTFLEYITNSNNLNILASISGILQGIAVIISLAKYLNRRSVKNSTE